MAVFLGTRTFKLKMGFSKKSLVPLLPIFITISFCISTTLSFNVEFGKLYDNSNRLPNIRRTSEPRLELVNEGSELLTSGSSEDNLRNIRERIRRKLSSYVNEVKLVHDLDSGDASSSSQIGLQRQNDHSRTKRDTIWADKLSSTGRRRRNYAAHNYELSYLDAGLTHVVRRVYQLQKPSFSTLNVTDLNSLTSAGITYVVAVERHPEGVYTVFYKYIKNWDLEEVGRLGTPDAESCEVIQIDSYNYVLPATYQPVNNGTSLDAGSPLYRIVFYPKFQAIKVQAINTEFAKSISFWRSSGVEANDMVLCVAPEKRWTSSGYRYNVEISCYRWQGGYFDITHLLAATNPQAMSYTHIASNSYMCVANYQDDSGSTAVFSTIFKYSHKRGIYIPHQKIKTYGAKDCQYFRFDSPEQTKEHYLAIANYGQSDTEGRLNYNVKSYIFKFGMGRMILFQSLPTFGAFQVLPIHDGPKFLLIFAEMNRISIYQHNGWNFVKTRHVDFQEENLVNRFRMRPMRAYNQTYFTVATPKLQSESGIYGLEFEPKNDYIKMSAELEEWCQEAVANIQGIDLIKLTQDASSVPNTTQPEIIMRSSLVFQAPLRTNTIFAQSLEHNLARFNAERSTSLARLERHLGVLEGNVGEMDSALHSAVTLNGGQTITTPLEFVRWDVANESTIVSTDYTTNFINHINVAALNEKLIFLHKNYLLPDVDIKILDAPEEIEVEYINGKPARDLLLASSPHTQTLLADNVFLQPVVAQQGLEVGGYLNGIHTDDILTARGNQHFQELRLRDSTVTNLVTPVLNGVLIDNLMKDAVHKHGEQQIYGNKRFTRSVSTPSTWTEKLLSGYDVNSIYSQAVNALNITETTFTGEPVFESFKVPALHVRDELINGKYKMQDFVSAVAPHLTFEGGEFTIYNNVSARDLDVNSHLNDIPVHNGYPNILLKHSSQPADQNHQQLSSHQLHSVRIENPARLDGTINGINLQSWNPTQTIELENKPLTADIVGRKIIFSQDLITKLLAHGSHNTLDIINNSIPLNSNNLPCRPKSIVFENLQVSGNAQVQTINDGISPSNDWISNNHFDNLITAPKHFNSDILLQKPSTANQLYLSTDDYEPEIFHLLDQVLINGTHDKDQIITGNVLFNNTLKIGYLNSDQQITLNNVDFKDILLTSPGQVVTVKSIFKNSIGVKNGIKIKRNLHAPKINDIDIAAAVGDTLRTTNVGVQTVQGHLKLVDSLFLNGASIRGTLGAFDVDALLGNIILKRPQKQYPAPAVEIGNEHYHNEDVEHIQGSLTFNNTIHLSSLNFAQTLNYEVSPDHWGSNWLTKHGNQEITTQFHFIHSLDSKYPHVVGNMVGQVDLNRLNSEILRKDDDNSLDHATFISPLHIKSGRICAAHFNGYDVRKHFLLKNSPLMQTVTGKKTFQASNWKIAGNLNAPKLANIDWAKLAQLTLHVENPGAEIESLHVEGHCHSNVEPSIQKTEHSSVNGFLWKDVVQNHWFRNENAIISKPLQFSSPLQLNGGTISGLIEDVDVKELESEYLSLSKNQAWDGNFVFQGPVSTKEVRANETHLKYGKLNGLDVTNFVRSVLLHGPNQTIASTRTAGNTSGINIKHVSSHNPLLLNGRINGLDICGDMVRIMGENHIRALKEIETLDAQNLQLNSEVRINGVSLYHWEDMATTMEGDYRLEGNRHLHSARFSHIVVNGYVNNRKVDKGTVLSFSGDQRGFGPLTVTPREAGTPTKFANVQINGRLNGKPVHEYFSNLALMNGTEPIHLYGPKTIEGQMFTKWLRIENRYEQHGIDLMEFLTNHNVGNYANKNYDAILREKYDRITNLTVELIHVASERAVTAKSFNRESSINHNGMVGFKVAHIMGSPTVSVIVKDGDSGFQTISWLTYNPHANAYVPSPIKNFTFYGQFRDFAQVQRKDEDFLFVSVSSRDNKLVTCTSPVSPQTTDFLLTNQTAKLSKGYVLRLEHNPNKTAHAVVHQVIFGDDFGSILSFRLLDTNGAKQDCVLYSVLNKGDFKALVFCFHPQGIYNREEDDAVHFFQTIPLCKSPQLTSLLVDNATTLVIISDGYRNKDGILIPHNDLINVWSHHQGSEQLLETDSFPVVNIVAIDSIVAPNYHPFLAVASGRLSAINHFGLVYLYRYSENKKKFVKYQTIQAKNPIAVRFLRLEPSDEVFLFILTGCGEDNVNVYAFKGISGWNKQFSFTLEGVTGLEPWDFVFQHRYKAQLLASNPTQVNIIDFQLNGIPYIPSHEY